MQLINAALSASEIYEHAMDKASYYKQFPNRSLMARTWEAIAEWILEEGITEARNHIRFLLSTCIVDQESRSAYQEWWAISKPTTIDGWLKELANWWFRQYLNAYEEYCRSKDVKVCWYWIGRGAGYYRAMQHIKKQEDANEGSLLSLLGTLQKEIFRARKDKYSLSINSDDANLKIIRIGAEIKAYQEAIAEVENLLQNSAIV
jgi:hypothetical protein